MADIIETVSATKKRSIARVELFTDAEKAPADWVVVFHFEDGLYDANSGLVGHTEFGTQRVERRFGDIQSDMIEVPPSSPLTIAAISAFIKAAGYKYRAEDSALAEAASAAARAAEEAAKNET